MFYRLTALSGFSLLTEHSRPNLVCNGPHFTQKHAGWKTLTSTPPWIYTSRQDAFLRTSQNIHTQTSSPW